MTMIPRERYRKLTDLLDDCLDRQITVEAQGDRLKIEGPKGALTPDLRGALTERKAEIINFLSRPRWYIDPTWQAHRIPLSLDKPPSEWLAECGLRIVGGDPATGALYVADMEAVV